MTTLATHVVNTLVLTFGGGIAAFVASKLFVQAQALRALQHPFSAEDAQAVRDYFSPHARALTPELLSSLSKKALLTPNEQEFYGRLVRALPEHKVLAQVSMGALIDVDLTFPGEPFSARDTFSRKIVDYVVCDAQLHVVALVELDDATHDAAKDAARDRLTQAAGYRTLRWESRAKPSEAQIRAQLLG